MLVSARISQGQAEVSFVRRRLVVMDVDRLYRDILHLLEREDVRSVVLDLKSIDLVDNSFVNMLRSLALEARRLRRRLRLSHAPTALRYLLSSSSHRLAWAAGLIPPDASSPIGHLLARSQETT